MKVENNGQSFFPQYEHRSKASTPPLFSSSIQMEESGGVKKGGCLSLFFEDLVIFFRNLFLFPFLGHQILVYQFLLILCLPILLPYIVFTELVYAFLHICTCGCLKRAPIPKFELAPLTREETAILSDFVAAYGNRRANHDHQIRLTHIMSRYIDYVARYTKDEDYGHRYARFQSLIKIDIDGTSELFQFCPQDDKRQILQEYLGFVSARITKKSQIKHHFIGLDYQYVLGLLKMELKADIVDYNCQNETEESVGICGDLIRYFSPKLEKHINKTPVNFDHFALWPQFTRNAICNQINHLLTSHDLESSQISLTDLDHLIRS